MHYIYDVYPEKLFLTFYFNFWNMWGIVVYLRYFKSYLFSIYYKNGLINFIEKISFVDLFIIRSSFGRISRCHDLWNLLFKLLCPVLLGLGITITCSYLLANFKALFFWTQQLQFAYKTILTHVLNVSHVFDLVLCIINTKQLSPLIG
jgi:hypothetical protein